MYYLIMPSILEDEHISVTEFDSMDDLDEWAELNDFEPADYVVVYGDLIHWAEEKE